MDRNSPPNGKKDDKICSGTNFTKLQTNEFSRGDQEFTSGRQPSHMGDVLELHQGLNPMDSLGLTVLENKSLFNGATTSTIRHHFRQWPATTVEAEQGVDYQRDSQRYRYCIQVDEEALDSVVRKPTAPWEIGGKNVGYVNFIDKEWEPYEPVYHEDEFNRLVDDPEELIEGCMLHNVGWMKVHYDSVMVSKYNYMHNDLAWDWEYHPHFAKCGMYLYQA
ncbi:hypothetical protein CDV55_107524 [Aspergillus turcosus]|nr:hypothetical protein CDV55_107524 [Aspergillus turcosus]